MRCVCLREMHLKETNLCATCSKKFGQVLTDLLVISIYNFFVVSVCLQQLFSAPRRPTLASEVPRETS